MALFEKARRYISDVTETHYPREFAEWMWDRKMTPDTDGVVRVLGCVPVEIIETFVFFTYDSIGIDVKFRRETGSRIIDTRGRYFVRKTSKETRALYQTWKQEKSDRATKTAVASWQDETDMGLF